MKDGDWIALYIVEPGWRIFPCIGLGFLQEVTNSVRVWKYSLSARIDRGGTGFPRNCPNSGYSYPCSGKWVEFCGISVDKISGLTVNGRPCKYCGSTQPSRKFFEKPCTTSFFMRIYLSTVFRYFSLRPWINGGLLIMKWLLLIGLLVEVQNVNGLF